MGPTAASTDGTGTGTTVCCREWAVSSLLDAEHDVALAMTTLCGPLVIPS